MQFWMVGALFQMMMPAPLPDDSAVPEVMESGVRWPAVVWSEPLIISTCCISPCATSPCEISLCSISPCATSPSGISLCGISVCGISPCAASPSGISLCNISPCGISLCDIPPDILMVFPAVMVKPSMILLAAITTFWVLSELSPSTPKSPDNTVTLVS